MENNIGVLSNKKTIPVLRGQPILGSVAAFRKDPVGTLYAGFQKAGEVFDLKIGARTFRVISDSRLAYEMLVEKKHIFQRPKMMNGATILAYLLGTSVLTVDGELWLSKRRMLQPIFHKQRIQAMSDQMQDAGAQMLARWQKRPAGEQVNLSEEMKLVTLDIINRTMFSANVMGEVDRIGQSVDIGLHYITDKTRQIIPIPDSWPTPANRRFQKSHALLNDYLYGIIRQRRSSSEHPGDLLDMLLEARDEDTGEGMNDEQIRNEVATIYGAGHETTAVGLTWAWYALNQNAEVLEKLQAELRSVLGERLPTAADLPNLPSTAAIFDETLRDFPPVPMTLRIPEEDTTLGGYAFPRGTFTNVSIYNLHHHPAYWDEPERFLPERFLPENRGRINRQAYIPFLNGPHLCIGNNFALMEGPLLLATMAQRYNIRLVPGQKVEREVAITMRPKGGMQVVLEAR